MPPAPPVSSVDDTLTVRPAYGLAGRPAGAWLRPLPGAGTP
ncbi:hypothetical protein [Streptomyces incarnatus]|nr:hypothetical protein [Streptomyces incarnatus]